MPSLTLPDAWNACVTSYLQSIYDLSGSDDSLISYTSILRRFFATGLHPNDVTRADVLAFVQAPSTARGRVGRPVSANTRNRRLATLTTFYRFASAWSVNGELLYDRALPTAGLKYGKPDIVYRALSAEELEQFFAAIPDTPVGWRDRALFLVYFWTARRKSEIARLRWKDIEPAILKDGSVARPGYIYRFQGKGKRRQTKARELPMPAYQALIVYLQKSGRLDSITPDDPLFAPTKLSGKRDRRDNPGINASYINLQFKKYCRLAGLSARFSLHSLRHTSAHERDQAGQKLTDISETLDHSHPGITWTYLRDMSGTSDNGVVLLEKRFAHL